MRWAARTGTPKVVCERVIYAGVQMQVPLREMRRGRAAGCRAAIRTACVWTLGALLVATGWAETPGRGERQGAVKISLESLGVPGISASFKDVGASMLTLHFLDDAHLLLTYSKRGLVPRIAGDPEGDDDRIVGAEVVELPAGKVVAQTEWHMHDHARYLWSLGRGRFLLRIRDSLYTLAPLANLQTPDPFQRTVFVGRGVRPTAVFISEDGGLLTVETQLATAKTSTIEVGDTVRVRPETTTAVDFYRLRGSGGTGQPLEVTKAGTVRAGEPLFLPIDSGGYLWAEQVGNNKWQVTFDDMRGKTGGMGVLDSSCVPRLEMVSRSEFLALTCRGADDRIRMASYGLDGTETWQEDVGELGVPVIVAAPGGGRFAVTRSVAAALDPTSGVGGMQQGAAERQEIRVYQTASGDQLLKVDASPVLKAAQNFDLAEDGTLLAVVKDGAVQVFKLPELRKKDKDDMAEVASFAPPAGTGPVVLKLLTQPRPQSQSTNTVPVPAEGPSMVLSSQMAGSESGGTAAGPRKPPTLLKPGEKPEFGRSNAQPD